MPGVRGGEARGAVLPQHHRARWPVREVPLLLQEPGRRDQVMASAIKLMPGGRLASFDSTQVLSSPILVDVLPHSCPCVVNRS